MMINGKNHKEYGIVKWRRELVPRDYSPVSVWVPGALSPQYIRHENSQHKLTLRVYLRGSSLLDADEKVFLLLEACRNCIMQFDDCPGNNYISILTGCERQTVGACGRMLYLSFGADVLGEQITLDIFDGHNVVNIFGAQKTDIEYDVFSPVAATVAVDGITVTTSAGETVCVRVSDCDLSKVTLTEFPQYEPGLRTIAAAVPNGTTVKLIYNPRW
jgi:hypothetical protein